jgi:hypothetical protein
MTEHLGTAELSLDDDGFLRRECPHCEREFKWLHSESGEPMQDGGYFCPYCAARSDDGWWTRPQFAHIEALALQGAGDYVEGMLDSAMRTVKREPPRPVPPVPDEPNDMRRIDFQCHTAEPMKVLEDWDGPLHCLICGTAV